MLRGAVLLLIFAAGRDLAPICSFQSKSGNYSVYNSEQWSRRDRELDAKFKVGEYHNTTCFKETEPPGVYDSLETNFFVGRASKMYAVQGGGRIELDKSDICYGWPETEPQFTRGPTLSEIKRENLFERIVSGECDVSRCAQLFSFDKFDEELPDPCINNIPRYCLIREDYYMEAPRITPYAGNGSNVQSFSGLATLNHDIISRKNGSGIIGPKQEIKLTIYLNGPTRSDCYLLFSAFSPLTGKLFPIDYIEFKRFNTFARYVLSERLIASLYNMGEFDLQFINNHRTHSCEDVEIGSIKAVSSFTVIRGATNLMSLDRKICNDGDSTSLEISFLSYYADIDYSLKQFPSRDFEVPINVRLEFPDKYSAAQIEKWEVYETLGGFKKEVCLVRNIKRDECGDRQKPVWIPLSGAIISNSVSTGTEHGGAVVEVELRVEMRRNARFISHIQIRNVCTYPQNISSVTVTLGELRSERVQPRNELAIIDAKEAVESIQIYRENNIYVHLSQTPNTLVVPLVLLKPRRTSRHFRDWDTTYSNAKHNNGCVYCYSFTTPEVEQTNDESFWDCRAKCKVDHTGFAISRSATFDTSEIPKLWNAEINHLAGDSSPGAHQGSGYAIDLGLPPCAQSLTQLTELKFSVAYTELLRWEKCQDNLLGTASLNVPEFTPSVYFKDIELDWLHRYEIGCVDENSKASSNYNFDPRKVVKKIGTLPRSIIIGYAAEYEFCIEKIKTIKVTYKLEYTPK